MPVLSPTSTALTHAVDELDWTTATVAASPVVQRELVACLQLLADRLDALGQDVGRQALDRVDRAPGELAAEPAAATAALAGLPATGPAR
ncbi:hypothetical protein [Arsenicicoccus dermatophilus]|uniref:hypothetical protein n=1 Tax=Arsenicicoccus dermatophilus TaxID=1076331 RepID=UPI001F4CC354|nr:hypothetical protein [Arsenicicoccus dermatophilus]MCH8613579.1 hypothetical protein [Arsenicicoccus dermatophilus]